MRTDRFDLALRVIVDQPAPGFAMALQRGATAKATLVPPTSASVDALVFDFTVTVDGALPDNRPRLLGVCVQGPPAARFVYLCIHGVAGARAPWHGRAKVPLKDLTWAGIEAWKPGERLCARYNGTQRGAPACGTVRLAEGWRAIRPG